MSWAGLRGYQHRQDLQRIFQNHAKHLDSIELDIVDWGASDEHVDQHGDVDEDAHFLAFEILQLEMGSTKIVFPSLRRLCLSNIDFYPAVSELLYAFNLTNLRTLAIRNCANTFQFLYVITDICPQIRLKSLEISRDDRDCLDEGPARRLAINGFLLLIKPGMETAYYLSILHHKSTLKRLIYHERLDREHTSSPFHDNFIFYERGDYRIQSPEYTAMSDPFRLLVEETSLDFLGICDGPREVARFMHCTLPDMLRR